MAALLTAVLGTVAQGPAAEPFFSSAQLAARTHPRVLGGHWSHGVPPGVPGPTLLRLPVGTRAWDFVRLKAPYLRISRRNGAFFPRF